MSTCADLARHHDEPLAGTAPVARGWLLVDQPGPWGRDAFTASRLDPVLGASVVAAAKAVGVRPQLIRRPRAPGDGGPPTGGPGITPSPTAATAAEGRRVVLAHAGAAAGATPWAEVLHLDDDALHDLDPAVCLEPTPPGLGAAHPGPLLLVCTHGRRDRCCATWGRPIVDTLAALHPEATWEVSHVGGHRFAGNLVILPAGTVHGGLDVAAAVQVVAAHLAGQVDPTHLRGRSGWSRPAQAAEVLVRRALGRHRADEVVVHDPATPDPSAADQVLVDVEVPGQRLVARLRRLPSGTARALSCDADDAEDPPAFGLLALEPVRDAAAS